MVFLFGAGDEARTRYLDLGKVALYQMSYARKRKVDYTAYFAVCQPCIFVLREKIKIKARRRFLPHQYLHHADAFSAGIEVHRPAPAAPCGLHLLHDLPHLLCLGIGGAELHYQLALAGLRRLRQ